MCLASCEEVVFGCVGNPSKCRGDCGGVSVEVIVVVLGFEPYPSIVRLIVVWLNIHPSKCRGDRYCVLPLV